MAKYTMLLQRVSEHKDLKKPNGGGKIEDSTIGTFTLTDEAGTVLYKGYSCENIGPSTDVANQDKRIMPRTYKLKWTYSSTNSSLAKKYPEYQIFDKTLNKHLQKAIWIQNPEDPKFSERRILIHVGNYPQDTLGCVLVGNSKGAVEGTISDSVEAINKLYKIIEKINIDDVDFIIKEI